MDRGNRPVKDANLHIRIPDNLKILLQTLSVTQRVTLSHIVTHLLESHPMVVDMAERLYAIGTETPAGKD